MLTPQQPQTLSQTSLNRRFLPLVRPAMPRTPLLSQVCAFRGHSCAVIAAPVQEPPMQTVPILTAAVNAPKPAAYVVLDGYSDDDVRVQSLYLPGPIAGWYKANLPDFERRHRCVGVATSQRAVLCIPILCCVLLLRQYLLWRRYACFSGDFGDDSCVLWK